MNLTQENYHSPKANATYMSNSTYKAWLDCPARQYAKEHNQWVDEETMAQTVGKYVDVALLTPKLLDKHVEANRSILFTSRGDKPRAEIQRADKMIERAERDDTFMGSLYGDNQRIITWEMFGVQWKAAIDAMDTNRGTLVDLKTCKDFEPIWSQERRIKLPFYEAYNYWLQLAVYREAYKSVEGNYPAIVAIAAVTKEEYPRLKVIQFDNEARFAHELEQVAEKLPTIIEYRKAKQAADVPACGKCDYCAEHQEAKMEMAESLVWQ